MKQLTFLQLDNRHEEDYERLLSLMIPYVGETDAHQQRHTPTEIISRVTRSMLNLQADGERHLELCYEEERLIGFFYGKLDRAEHRGMVRPGWGYIMEFYVKPQYRRRGYGTRLYQRLEDLLMADGATRLYLTADPITGTPFWNAMGFSDSKLQSVENQLNIYEKTITTQIRNTE